MNRYRKLLAALGPVVVLGGEAISDGELTGGEVATVATALVGAFLVWLVPNVQDATQASTE